EDPPAAAADPPQTPDPEPAQAADPAEERPDPTASPKTAREDAPPRNARARRVLDPYALLRVPRGSSLEDVKRAYYQRIKAVHPDTLASLGLDDDVVKAAHLTAQRINQAYERVLRDYQRPSDTEEPSAAEAADPQTAA
ncbi:MAG: J domain-containing protein, partial [Parvularculaceae bacterium]|nr:J domain-containing protein [Parvularculaceae bacterium]